MRNKFIYLTFLPDPILSGFPAFESAVPETFGLTCLGFLASLFPRLLLPLDICFPYLLVQRSLSKNVKPSCCVFSFGRASSRARLFSKSNAQGASGCF